MENDDDHVHHSAHTGSIDRNPVALERLGWRPFFAQQTSAEETADTPPVRVVAVHRSGLQVVGAGIDERVPPRADVTVGDWLLLDRAQPRASRVLSRKSLVKRRAPGQGDFPRAPGRCGGIREIRGGIRHRGVSGGQPRREGGRDDGLRGDSRPVREGWVSQGV